MQKTHALKYDYEVAIPWKGIKYELPNNYTLAYNRLKTQERKLEKDQCYASHCL